MLEYVDRLGNHIRPGDWVVYGRNLGRCATTALGRVVEVKPKTPSYQGFYNRPRAKRVTLQEVDRVLLYEAFNDWDAVRRPRVPHTLSSLLPPYIDPEDDTPF